MNGPLQATRWGAGDGPRALLVHGITSSAETMWELAEPLAAAGWSVTAVDLPGHGASGPARSYRFDDVAHDIASAYGSHWDLYVGHSLGGALGTVLLANHRRFARRAVFVDPPLRASEAMVDTIPVQLVADKFVGEDEVAAAHPHWHPRTVRARVDATAQADVDAVAAWVAQNQPWDLVDLAARVEVPVHVLVASDGSALAPGVADEIVAANPRWTFETVPDSTHSVHRDHPALVVQRLLG